jgi:tetratricopeptide (TPR) repeat protein
MVLPEPSAEGPHATPSAETNAPFVGRDDAVEELRSALREVVAQALSHSVALVGPVGAGKSRLIAEFLKTPEAASVRVLRARARHEDVSYGVFSRLLADWFGLNDEMPDDLARSKVAEGVKSILGSDRVDDVCFFLGQMMGLAFPESPVTRAAMDEPGQAAVLRRSLVRRFLEAATQKGPVIIVLEDLHLADEDSVDLLGALLGRTRGPLLVLCVGGRELLSLGANWGPLETHKVIELGPLSHQAARSMIRNLLARAQGDGVEALIEAGLKAAGGVPGQLAQMVRSYIDAGVLEEVKDPNGSFRVNLDLLSTVRLPMTVDDALSLRISALSAAERRVLEHAAATGNVFWLGGLVALGRMDREAPEFWQRPDTGDIARIEEILDRLVERDHILVLEDAVFADEKEYVFRHSFEREKVAALVSSANLRRYHQTIADWLAQKSTARSREEYVAMLAMHLERAGSLTRAAFTYLDAGDIARGHFALRKAAEYYKRGLELLKDDDARRRIDALHNSGDVLLLLGKNEDAMDAFRQMQRLAYMMNLPGKGGAAHNRIGRLYRDTGFLAEASRHITAALSLFTAVGDTRGVAASHDDMGKLLWLRGDYDDALKELKQALEMRQELGDRRSIALSLNNIGMVWMDHGRPKNAKEALEASLAIRREINDPVGVAESLSTLGALSIDQNEFESALDYFREALAVSEQIGERTRIATCLTNIGETLERLGQGAEAIRTLDRAVQLCTELGDKLQLAEARRGLAKSHLLRGDLKNARRNIRTAVQLFGEVRSKAHLAIALRTLGEITGAGAWGGEHEGKAVEYFMRSIAIAKEIGNEIEVARSYLAFSSYVSRSGGYAHSEDIQREAAKLREMAEEIFERHRMAIQSVAPQPRPM